MGKDSNRSKRVGDLIQVALAEIMQNTFNAEFRGFLTITGVELSRDLSFARVYISVLEEEKAKETIAALNKEVKALRYELAHAVKLRITPELLFVYDDSIVRGSKISALIHKVADK